MSDSVDQKPGSSIINDLGEEWVPYMDLEFDLEFLVGKTSLSAREFLGVKVGDTIKLGRRSVENLLLVVDEVELGEAELHRTQQSIIARVVKISTES